MNISFFKCYILRAISLNSSTKRLFNFKAHISTYEMRTRGEEKVHKEAHSNNDGSNRAMMGMHVLLTSLILENVFSLSLHLICLPNK